MSIHFISGKPGGGKSLYGMRLIIEELVHGHRAVITNVPIKPGALNEYLQRNYPNISVDLHTRLRLLSDEEAGKFWTIRPEGSQGPALLSKEDWHFGKRPDYSATKDSGVMYAIDEVHNYFNARHWMETGRDVLFYLSQHRKLGDTVICITQHIANVDKQFRSVAQDYTYIKNLKKAKMGMFKLPGLFVRRTYPEPATPTSACSESGTFKLDVSGVASCYDTAVGVGIHGRVADKSEGQKGIPWYVPLVVIPLVLFAVYKYGPSAITSFFSRGHAEVTKQMQPQAAKVVPPSAERPKLPGNPTPKPPEEKGYPGVTNPVVYCVMKHRLNGYWEVSLSDGQTYRQGDLGLDQIHRNGVVVFGRFYPDHPPLTGESSFKSPYSNEQSPVATALRTSLVITNL